MAKTRSESVVTQSLMERLITSETDDVTTSRAQSLRIFRDALKRDVEWLLNSRRPPLDSIANYPLAANSVINYGLPDISSMGLQSASDQRTLIAAVQQCLRNFEPRITDVRVFLESSEVVNRSLRFRIEGMMMVDPAPEEINFDTVLELTKGEYEIR
jgi:type VI secretion system protein ImpF